MKTRGGVETPLILAFAAVCAERRSATNSVPGKVAEWRAGSLELRSAKGPLSTLRKPGR